MDVTKLDLDTLLEMLSIKGGGHYTIFKFSTHYKVGVGTPSNDDIRAFLHNYPAFPTLKEAVIHAVLTGMSFDTDFVKRLADFRSGSVGYCFDCNRWHDPKIKPCPLPVL